MVRCLTDLVILFDCFFNSMVVGVPRSLLFWHFWLFIDFRLIVILLLVVRGSEAFLSTPPSWPELPDYVISKGNIKYFSSSNYQNKIREDKI